MFGLDDDHDDSYMTVKECAELMNTTPELVRQLAKLGILRTRYGWRDVFVQPAAVRGWTG